MESLKGELAKVRLAKDEMEARLKGNIERKVEKVRGEMETKLDACRTSCAPQVTDCQQKNNALRKLNKVIEFETAQKTCSGAATDTRREEAASPHDASLLCRRSCRTSCC